MLALWKPGISYGNERQRALVVSHFPEEGSLKAMKGNAEREETLIHHKERQDRILLKLTFFLLFLP